MKQLSNIMLFLLWAFAAQAHGFSKVDAKALSIPFPEKPPRPNALEKGYAVLDTITFQDIKRSCIPGIGSFIKLVLDAPIRGKKPTERYCKLYKNGVFGQLYRAPFVQSIFNSIQEKYWFDKTARNIHAIEVLYFCADTSTQCDTVFLNIQFRGIGTVIQSREFGEDLADLMEDITPDLVKPIHFPKHKYRAWITGNDGELWIGRFAAANDSSLFLVTDRDEWHEEVIDIPYSALYNIGTRRKGAPLVGIAVGLAGLTIAFSASSARDPITKRFQKWHKKKT